MGIDNISTEALNLPIRERIRLAESLWESIGDPYDDGSRLSDQDAIDLAIERDHELESGIVEPISHDEMMRRLRP